MAPAPVAVAVASPPATTAEAITLPTASEPETTTAVTVSQPVGTASAAAAPDELEIVNAAASEPAAEAGQPAGIASADAILQKAREYHEVGSFKKMVALLDENQDLVGEMPEAAALRLEQYLNEPQPDYRLMRSVAGIILERDAGDAAANYAMGLYWSNLKKPDLGKALQHLALAKNAKKPHSGAASLYWRLYAKNSWYLFLLPLAIVAAAIDRRRKRQAGLPTARAAPEQDGSGRLSSLTGMLAKLMAKFRRQPAPPSSGEPPDEGPGQSA